MQNNYLLYQIISPSNKIYIGVTNSFKRRMSEHLSDWKNRPQKIALHNSFTKYGYDAHKKEILIKGLPREMAYKIEERLVKSLETTNSKIGLNSRQGGKGGFFIDWNTEKGKEIQNKSKDTIRKKYENIWVNRLSTILEMKDEYTTEQIAKKLNCAKSALGRYMKLNNIHVKRKSKYDLNYIAEIIKPYYEAGKGNKDVMQITGYSKGTICRAKKIALGDEGH